MNTENLTLSPCGTAPQRGSTTRRIAQTLACWRQRARQRDELAQLDAANLRDLGLNDADIWRETRKAPWES